jgi:hypothetical protein
MELAVNIQSGWNLGRLSVKSADVAKILCWSETPVTGPGQIVTKNATSAPTSQNSTNRKATSTTLPHFNCCAVRTSHAIDPFAKDHPDYLSSCCLDVHQLGENT